MDTFADCCLAPPHQAIDADKDGRINLNEVMAQSADLLKKM